ncbi:MAG TPA: hypothetical protein VGF16_15190 [Bryobacteraceae bacterium]
MMSVVAILLFGAILACMGVLVKWELKRAKRGPRFNPKSLESEGTSVPYMPPAGPKRIFELDARH